MHIGIYRDDFLRMVIAKTNMKSQETDIRGSAMARDGIPTINIV